MFEPIASETLPDNPSPDVMNDPQYVTNTPGAEDGVGDPDTCRICRGEGSDTEPLFHPCKCSGSIKHVHQDCLMEWLSHSQKKHCELCKTPFRFTKLYSPNMPQSLPPTVFLRHFVLHSIRNVATWLRFCLVVTVWLGCLPWAIRQVWRLLFWFSDGGWPSRYSVTETIRNSTTIQALEMAREYQQAILAANGTSPVTPFHAVQTTPASMNGIVDKLMGFLMPFIQNVNTSDPSSPLTAGLFNALYRGLGSVMIPDGPVTDATVSKFIMKSSPPTRNTSLLGDVSLLKNLTKNPIINQLVITIAEGYIITILVVICFVLVFLIREWVVQQQPGINMGAGFNAEFPAERPREQIAAEERQNGELQPGRHAMDNLPAAREVANRPIAQPRRRNIHFDTQEELRRLDRQWDRRPNENETGEPSGQSRPTPVRDALTPAAEIQRQLTEEPRMTEEFLAIWRRADSDPKEVLRIIESENKADQMRYWVNAMKVLQHPLPQDALRQEQHMPSPRLFQTSERNPTQTESMAVQAGGDGGSTNSDNWVDVAKPISFRRPSPVPDPKDSGERTSNDLDKGKGRAADDPKEPLFDPANQLLPGMNFPKWNQGRGDSWNSPQVPVSSFPSNSARPRAISDGPRPKDSISPLANHNWSFSTLSSNNENIDPKDDDMVDSLAEPRSITSPSNSKTQAATSDDRRQGSQAWKAAQDLRVQKAIAKGREATKAALERPTSSVGLPVGPTDFETDAPVEVRSQDGVLETCKDAEEHFMNAPVQVSDSEDDADEHHNPEPNPFAPDTPLPEARELIIPPVVEPQGLLGQVAEWLWGGNDDDRRRDEQGPNDEHIVQDLAAEAPFVPVAHHDPFDQARGFAEQDRDVVEAAIAAGLDPNDPDAIDDAEDFEGIMELVGMRGPIFSLVQNAVFSAFLLALTVAFGVWIPYNIGRVSLLLLANPSPTFKLPLRLVFWVAAFLQDLVASVVGVTSYCAIAIISLPLSAVLSGEVGAGPAAATLKLSHDAVNRIMDGTVSSLIHVTDSEIFAFSAASHDALLTLKCLIIDTLKEIGRHIIYLFVGDYRITPAATLATSTHFLKTGFSLLARLPTFLAKPDSWVISLEVAKRSTPLDLELSVWDGTDRFWATLAGYTTLSLLGSLYIRKGSPFSNGQIGREWEATIIDLLNQAGGVMKVILIISIEMLVFPLYCGLLLDAALLPLFEKATIMSRILFTFKSPLTSIFVHWFVGTCYMFHFALFVSMCRKIMRKGVLYFIRDPDDPTFHPVRDVLERNVATQLRKILFSALVYGALVVVCLGGVVWSLAFAFKGVLPIHWSSNEPVLEFPIDLLFYNFLMPLAVKFFKPSDGLHAMYSWWFRQCARLLRLTWFMFDERKLDEEGYNVRRTWGGVLRCVKGDPLTSFSGEDPNLPFIEDADLSAYFHRDGRYVRAPASDQVRIPKGTQIFLQVDEHNNRMDGKWDHPDGIHGRDSELYKQVYIPPYFRLRICAFILSIWIFAALTGVSITIVPLVFGRQVFAKIIPSHVRKNDVYAFSIGIYILGSTLYAILHLKPFITYLLTSFSFTSETPRNVLNRIAAFTSRVTSLLWTYTAFLFLLPALFALLIEFYAILPIHTYFAPKEAHTIHFVQSWTLGLLYVKLTTRLILFYSESRPAVALRAITRNGYLNPDARLATRSFILPASLALGMALAWPWALARLALMTAWRSVGEEEAVNVYRFVYPAVLAVGLVLWGGWLLVGCVKGWRMKIRDEVYLIGERLHNFGERKSTGTSVGGVVGVRRIET